MKFTKCKDNIMINLNIQCIAAAHTVDINKRTKMKGG